MSKKLPKSPSKIIFVTKKSNLCIFDDLTFWTNFCVFGTVCNALASATQLTRWSGAFRVAVAFLGETECFENVVHDMSS